MAPLLLLLLSPLLGGLPLIDWITRLLTGKRLAQLGTGNVSVSAAFYHGGRVAGILAVLSEAGKGIAVVLLSRSLGLAPAWELAGLLGLVLGRYGWGQGAGTTNLVWGYLVHDWRVALGVALGGGLYFVMTRQRRQSRYGVLLLMPILEAWRSPQDVWGLTVAIALGLLMAWIYGQQEDDLDLNPTQGHRQSRSVFRFFQGRSRLLTLADRLDPAQVGSKAATLSQLHQWGYAVPSGWVLQSHQSAQDLLDRVSPSPQQPWVVRSSAIGEDSLQSSAAGQYLSILAVTGAEAMLTAIQQVRASYDRPAAQQYRRDRVPADPTLANKPQADRPQRDSRRDSRQGEGRSSGSNNGGMSVIIQQQISGQLSGVAFSRDPLEPGDAVVIEALPGGADAVVSGQVTPESFRILLQSPENSEKSNKAENSEDMDHARDCSHSQATAQSVNAFDRDNPQTWTPILEAVAQFARDLEQRYHGIPQDMEWTYDGKQLWILQTRPITTLQPLWTRKIAAEVIPGAIRPLTWSLNRPLTCGVWGEIFTIVLGDRAQGLDFQDTATLHNSHAYFNATLLGDIFRRMGLPAESLEFLTLGAKFSRPPIASTLGNIPGLLRLLGRIWTLERDFQCDYGQNFEPALDRWLSDEFQTHLRTSSPAQISQHLAEVRALLPRATYYQILAPLGFALGRAILRSEDEDLDQSVLPEVAALRSLQTLATQIRSHFIDRGLDPATLTLSPSESLQTQLEQTPSGSRLWQQLQGCIQQYGYLSDVGTDIAIANWHDDPTPALALVCQFIQNPPPTPQSSPKAPHSWLQTRLTLKGKVAQVYLQLLAEMRRSLLLLADRWVATGLLSQGEDLFFLTWSELDTHLGQAASSPDPVTPHRSAPPIAQRRHQWHQSSQDPVPFLVYGSTAAVPSAPRATAAVFDSASVPTSASATAAPSSQPLQGIGASRGQAEGVIRVVQNLQTWPEIDRNTILVVPYTDAGWAPLLAQAAGVIAETGGRLSHGAIVAREYGIPAVMGIERATTRLQTGQRVRLDGYQGTVTLL